MAYILAAIMALSAVTYAVYDYKSMAVSLEKVTKERDYAVESYNLKQKEYENYIGSLERQVAALRRAVSEVSNNYAKVKRESAEQTSALDKHNLYELSKSKPGLIERRINSATSRLFDSVEKATAGSEL